MLAWALWISFTLTGILRHGWQVVSKPVLWQLTVKKVKGPGRQKNAGHKEESEMDFVMELDEEDVEKDK
jgi:hypothetical protein